MRPTVDADEQGMQPAPGLRREILLSRTAPFIVVAALPMLILCFTGGVDERELLIALGLLVSLIAAVFLVPWRSLPRWSTAIVPLSYLLVVALMRASESGATMTSGALVVIPVLWFALYGGRRELIFSIVGAIAVFVIPALLAGAASDVLSELNKAVTFGLVVTLVGFAAHRLVGENSTLIAKLDLDANRDHLTGLPNRHAWTAMVDEAISRSTGTGAPLFVAMIDLDGLKAINDEGGHAAGDRALRTAARTWSEAMPESSSLARLGGDEFALLLPGLNRRGAMAAVEVIRRATGDTLPCSIGLIRRRLSESSSALLKRADLALYVAKARGGNQISDDTRSGGPGLRGVLI